jgi:hypothetical protein
MNNELEPGKSYTLEYLMKFLAETEHKIFLLSTKPITHLDTIGWSYLTHNEKYIIDKVQTFYLLTSDKGSLSEEKKSQIYFIKPE